MLNALNINSYIKNTIIVLMCMLCMPKAYAQFDKLVEAQDLAKEKKYAQAIYLLEQTLSHPETKEEPQTWYLRSLSYSQYYKQVGDYSNQKCALLDTAVSSALKSNKLRPEEELKNENLKIIESVGNKFYKIAGKLLADSLNVIKSEMFYQKYKRCLLMLDPNRSLKELDINYYTAMSSQFTDLFIKSNFSNSKYGETAKSACFVLLDIDPKNIKANYNLGVIYYNQAATLMREMDYDIDIASMDVVQENAKKLFKQSEPYMTKVYELEPNDEKVLNGLEGIYYALNDLEKSQVFKQKKEALEQKNKK